jgi:4-aminobutyrate aminotransferase-like enzyme
MDLRDEETGAFHGYTELTVHLAEKMGIRSQNRPHTPRVIVTDIANWVFQSILRKPGN